MRTTIVDPIAGSERAEEAGGGGLDRQVERPVWWQVVHEAIDALGGRATYGQIRDYVTAKWPDANMNSLNATLTLCSVNQPSRVHYPENKKPRLATDSRYDILFSLGRGEVELYDSERHGQWEIRPNEFGGLEVGQTDLEHDVEPVVASPPEQAEMLFPLESHLRDFIAANLSNLSVDDRTLRLYQDETGRDGIEYRTDVGPIDILAVDNDGNFVVFELKLSRGPDSAMGQIARYMGWVKKNLAQGHEVKGAIVAKSVDRKLRYAVSVIPEIHLFEYDVRFDINPVVLD